MYPDKPSDARNAPQFLRALGPVGQMAGICSVGMVVLGVLLAGVAPSEPALSFGLGLGAFVLAIALMFPSFARSYPHTQIGWCNTVTILRLVLVSALFAWLVHPPASPWTFFGVAAIAFAMDGLDGWLARREGLVSDFGARFDMEVDSIFALIIAIAAFTSGAAGWFVLLLGLPRYGFFVAQFAFPWIKDDLPPRFSRKVACVLQIAVLIVLLVPGFTVQNSALLVAVALGVVAWSFWVDIRWLRQARG